jgi:uncharacterized protein
MPVIDMRVSIPRRKAQLDPKNMMDYYQEKAGFDLRYGVTDTILLQEMEAVSITMAVAHSEWEIEEPYLLNMCASEFVKNHPGKFAAVVSVDPRNGVTHSLQELRMAVENTKCMGLSLQPAFFHMVPEDARLYLLYQYCEEHRIPVWLHTGINYAPNHSFESDHPIHLERILLDFPSITLVACHSAWPWVGEVRALARKFYPRLFLEIGGVAPKYIFMHGTGWDPFLHYANSLLQDQVLFGTDWPIIPFSRAIKEINEALLKETIKQKILYGNGLKLINKTLAEQKALESL